MKFISLFCGIGGFDLALERLGYECVYANDIDKYCKLVYDRHFRTKLDLRDIRTVEADELPDFDLLCGGFPCQAFSIAGKRRGFEETRGTLFFEIARIVQAKRPTYLFLENVKGLLSHDMGRTFETIMRTIDELGYDAQWQVCNSKNFGVPQNRERVFIIGHLRGTRRPEVFPIRQDGSGFNERREGIQRTVSAETTKANSQYPNVKVSQDGKNGHLHQITGGSQGYRVYDPSGISTTLASQAGGVGAKTGLYAVAERGRYNAEGKIEQQLEPRFDGLTNTLTGVEKDNRVFDGVKIRRLTPVECERLQGFTDNWTAEGVNEKGEIVKVSDTQRYKMCGNAVTVNTAYEIAKRAFQ